MSAPLAVYVASAWDDYPRARAAMAALRDAGCVVTHDWTAYVDVYPANDAPPDERAKHAREDIDGVANADVVLVLTPADRSRGAGVWIEMGAALALGKRVVLAGAQRDRSVFCSLAEARFERDEQAITCLATFARTSRFLDEYGPAEAGGAP